MLEPRVLCQTMEQLALARLTRSAEVLRYAMVHRIWEPLFSSADGMLTVDGLRQLQELLLLLD